jgi:hypothetical protein
MIDASGKSITMDKVLKKYQSEKIFSAATLDLKKLSPTRDAVRKNNLKPLRMRFNGTFVQYAEKGELLKIGVQAFKLGHNNSPVSLDIVSPSGKLLGTRKVNVKQKPEFISLNTEECGIFQFKYRTNGNGVSISSDSPGNGYLADRQICANGTPGKIYFLVSAGIKEVAVRINGTATETVTAALLNPSGTPVMEKKKISSLQLLSSERNNSQKTEIWSVVFSQVVDDFCFAVVGEAIPIVSDSPDKLFEKIE